MAPKILSRPGKALVQSLIVFPFCLSVVAMAAISPAFSALRRYQAVHGNAAYRSAPEVCAIEQQVEDGLMVQSSDDGPCASPYDLD
jgi:hypothetical protein